MPKSDQIKIFIHHGRFISIKAKKSSFALKTIAKLLNAIFDFFYFIGFGVINFFSALTDFAFKVSFFTGQGVLQTFGALKNDLLKTRHVIPKRLSLFKPKVFKSLPIFIFTALIAWGALSSMLLFARGLEIKNKLLRTVVWGSSYLNEAQDALSLQNYSLADDRFASAYQTFSQGQKQMQESGQALNQILNLLPKKKDGERLIKAAALLSQSGRDALAFKQNFENIKLGISGINTPLGNTAEILNLSQKNLNKISGQVSEAHRLVSEINPDNVPEQNRQNFLEIKQKLAASKSALANFREIFDLTRNLVLGQKTVLILLENNNELRASGGFIGTYAHLKINDGNLGKVTVSSIYDLDGQLTEIIKPPFPILNLSDRWFMRDANWFADFPQTAKKISNFYEMEGGETPDLVVALTPNLVVDWLKITGPIEMPSYGVTLSSENFIEQTQAITTLSNELPTNAPKQILADLLPLLLDRLGHSNTEEWTKIIQALQNNLNQKQIAFYSRDKNLQGKIAKFNWAGDLKTTDRDFLFINSSNLGGTKTDLSIEQKIKLTTQIDADGFIQNELEITRTSNMPNLPQAAHNLSFLRVYVPLGSKLISNTGFDYKTLEYPEGLKYKTDSDAKLWEKHLLRDVTTGTVIGQEAQKTFFGNWMDLKPGQSKTVRLVYQLPFRLNVIDRYSLLLQKQLGSSASAYEWQLIFPGRQAAYKTFEPKTEESNSLDSDIMLNKDYFFGLVFEKKINAQ